MCDVLLRRVLMVLVGSSSLVHNIVASISSTTDHQQYKAVPDTTTSKHAALAILLHKVIIYRVFVVYRSVSICAGS
jgi:hypothetical protein